MATKGLTSIIDTGFLNSFLGVAKKQSGGSALQSALSGGASSVGFADGLRVGARAFGNAVQGLNSLVTVLNISENTLDDLLDLTDDMIRLADRASKSSTSSSSRSRLNFQYHRLADKFERILDKAKFGQREILDMQDISDIFVTLGLDQENADSIAQIFEQFRVPDGETSLASDKSKGDRPIKIPADAYGKRSTTVDVDDFELLQKSNAAAQTGSASTVNNVYQALDTVLNYNPTKQSLITQSEGSIVSGLEPGLTSDVVLKDVNEQTGFSVIESDDDFLGHNSNNVKQLYLVDNVGNIVHQFTNFGAGADITFDDVSLRGDDLAIAVSYRDNLGGTTQLHTITTGSIGANPATATDVTFENVASANAITNVELNNAGTYIAYIDESSNINFKDTATQTQDATMPAIGSPQALGFLSNNELAVLNSTTSVLALQYGGGLMDSYSPGGANFSANSFSTLEQSGYFTVLDSSDNGLKLLGYSGGSVGSPTLVDTIAVGTVYGTSMAVNTETSSIDIGVDGQILADVSRGLSRYTIPDGSTSYSRTSITSSHGTTIASGTYGAATEYSSDFAVYDVTMGVLGSPGSNVGLVTSLLADDAVGVLLGNADGTFKAAVTYSTTSGPSSAELGDVDGDSILDIVTSNLGGTVGVLLGNADGTFKAETTFNAQAIPTQVLLQDLNGDNKLDIISVDNGANRVSAFLGNGDGTFKASVSFETASGPSGAALGDYNGDGKIDLAVVGTAGNDVSIMLGNGNGTFAARSTFDMLNIGFNGEVSVGDIDEDGDLDFVANNYSGNSITITLGNGDGTFAAPTSLASALSNDAIQLVDVNDDRFLDIVSVGTTLDVHLGNGDGTFKTRTSNTIGFGATGVAVGSVDGDSINEIVTANYGDVTVSVLQDSTTTAGTYAGAISAVTSVFSYRDTILDYNNDYISLFQTSVTDTTAAIRETLVDDVDHLTTNEVTGYSVIESTDDFLGYNSSNYSQLFLVDATGHIVQQMTNNNTVTRVYQEADLSLDNKTVAFKSDFAGAAEIGTATFSVFGQAPSGNTVTIFDTSAVNEDYDQIALSSDGSHIAYRFTNSGGTTNVVFKDTATQTTNAALAAITDTNLQFDFIDTNTLAIVEQDTTRQNIISYAYSSATAEIIGDINMGVGGFKTLERSLTGSGDYYILYEHNEFTDLRLYREGSGEVGQYEYDASEDSVSTLSLAPVTGGTLEAAVGAYAELSTKSGDTDNELYRLEFQTHSESTKSTALSKTFQEFESLFDKRRTLANRPDAYRLLHDLKALRSNIEENIDVIDFALNRVNDNLDLVRTAGFAFLDLADQIKGTEKATEVARLLRREIRKAPAAALSQAENLEPIAVAALLLDNDSLLGN